MIQEKNTLKGYLFLAPILILIALFLIYPFMRVIHVSFYATRFGFGKMEFDGFNNYLALFRDEVFRVSIKNSIDRDVKILSG